MLLFGRPYIADPCSKAYRNLELFIEVLLKKSNFFTGEVCD